MLETDHKFASYFIASLNQVEKTGATMVFGKELTLSQSGRENDITLCIIKANSPSEVLVTSKKGLSITYWKLGLGVVTAKSPFRLQSSLPSPVISLPKLPNLCFCTVGRRGHKVKDRKVLHAHSQALRGWIVLQIVQKSPVLC